MAFLNMKIHVSKIYLFVCLFVCLYYILVVGRIWMVLAYDSISEAIAKFLQK